MPTQTAGNRPAQHMLRIGTIAGVPQALKDLGLVPDEVLSKGGFDPRVFDDPENLISFTARGHLMAHCASRAKCGHFGLLVGQQASLSSLGLVGQLVKYSPDVMTALNDLTRYFHLHGRGSAISLQVQGDTATLEYQIHQSEAEANDQIGTGAVAILYNILRELCGPNWKVLETRFIQRPSEDAEPFRKFFKARPHFNSEQNALVFRSTWLARALPAIDTDARERVKKQIESLAALHDENFPEQVSAVVRAAFVSGHIKTDQVAALFSIHPRTLNRRLRAYGLGYQELVDDIRFGLARQMLHDSDLGVSEIALILHYATERSFIRAFRRWSGETPARWRAAQRGLQRGLLTT